MVYPLCNPVKEPDLRHAVQVKRFARRVSLSLFDTCAVGTNGTEFFPLHKPVLASIKRLHLWHAGLQGIGAHWR